MVWKVGLWSSLASGVRWQHDLDEKTEDTLTEEHVADSAVNEDTVGVSGVDHESVDELHVLGTLSADLSRHDDLDTLGTRLHDEAHDTRAGTADGKTSQKLEAEALALGHGAETTVGNALGVELRKRRRRASKRKKVVSWYRDDQIHGIMAQTKQRKCHRLH